MALEDLRNILLALRATGADGFEGLVASVVAAKTGLQIRLAKSGLQLGRDASSPAGEFAIAIEAKLYTSNLRIQELMGKLSSATAFMGGDTDLWLLCTTVELGDDAVRKLSDVVPSQGMSIVFLDWSLRPLPPLAVLLAGEANATLDWVGTHAPSADRERLASCLDTVANDAAFAKQLQLLSTSLSAAENGLDALRKCNAEWIRARFTDPFLSRESFGQRIIPLGPHTKLVPRSGIVTMIGVQLRTQISPTVIVILGEEGVGKTWLSMGWWLTAPESPILIPVIGRRVELLDPLRPEESIAGLLANDYGVAGKRDIAPWLRKLERWSKHESNANGTPRFVFLLDGVNERPDVHWADNINALARVLSKLSGVLLCTSRPAYWDREVNTRLDSDLKRITIQVGGYENSEVEVLLHAYGIDLSSISHSVRESLRNPRLCNLALDLIHRGVVSVRELTNESLLLAYWQYRLAERGDLIGHNILDFYSLLKAHAKEWRSRPHQGFAVDDWLGKSGIAKRNPTRDLSKDLEDIIEGRFMKPATDGEGLYEFRPETLPFALGLELAHLMRSQQNVTDEAAPQVMNEFLEPIRSLGLTSKVLVSTFGLACFDASYPLARRQLLLENWASLQNVSIDSIMDLHPYVAMHPETFFDTVLTLQTTIEYSPQQSTLVDLILESCDDSKVLSVLQARVPEWLGRWSRTTPTFPNEKTPEKENPRLVARLTQLSSEEHQHFANLCKEMSLTEDAQLDELAVLLMTGSPMAPIAHGIWGWALSQSIEGDYRRSGEDLAWLVRLNPFDWFETYRALSQILSLVSTNSSAPFRAAAVLALNLTGTTEASERASVLSTPSPPGSRFRRVEQFCNTNPHDPSAPRCSNLESAIQAVQGIDLDQVSRGRFSTKEDHDLNAVAPALARFAPEVISKVIQKLVKTIEERSDAALRGLVWDLPEYSALLTPDSVACVERALDRFISEPRDWSNRDSQFIVSQLLRAIFPHVDARRQLELLLKAPLAMPEFLTLRQSLKELHSTDLEKALEATNFQGGASSMKRVMFLASGRQHTITKRACEIIERQLISSDTSLTNVACDLISRTNEPNLDQALLRFVSGLPEATLGDREQFWHSQAIATVVARENRSDMFSCVTADLRQSVAAVLGGKALRDVTLEIDAAIKRLLEPVDALMGHDSPVIIETTPTGFMQRMSVPDEEDVDLRTTLKDISDPEAAAQRFSDQQKQQIRKYHDLEQRVSLDGARAVLEVPVASCLREIVEHSPQKVRDWLTRILAVDSEVVLRQLFNIGVGLAASFARLDGELSASVLTRLEQTEPFVRVVEGRQQIPLLYSAVFTQSSASPMDALRERYLHRSFHDADLELCVRAAERYGTGDWLLAYIDHHAHAENPGLQARAMTIAGYCAVETDLSNVFRETRGTGFLNEVATFALKNRTRALWAKHWCEAAICSTDAASLWSYGKLAEGVVDLRFTEYFEDLLPSQVLDTFGEELYERLSKAAGDRSKKRKETLFGLKGPSDRLRSGLQRAARSTSDQRSQRSSA